MSEEPLFGSTRDELDESGVGLGVVGGVHDASVWAGCDTGSRGL